jgi:hypothetical protein
MPRRRRWTEEKRKSGAADDPRYFQISVPVQPAFAIPEKIKAKG